MRISKFENKKNPGLFTHIQKPELFTSGNFPEKKY